MIKKKEKLSKIEIKPSCGNFILCSCLWLVLDTGGACM